MTKNAVKPEPDHKNDFSDYLMEFIDLDEFSMRKPILEPVKYIQNATRNTFLDTLIGRKNLSILFQRLKTLIKKLDETKNKRIIALLSEQLKTCL